MRNSARSFTIIAILVALVVLVALLNMRQGSSLSDSTNIPDRSGAVTKAPPPPSPAPAPATKP